MTRPIRLPMSTEIDRAQVTLAMEIEKAKKSLILANAQIEWCSLRWDLSDLTERTSPAAKKVIAHIRPMQAQKPFPTDWADLLRTLIIWLLEEKSGKGEIWKLGTLTHIIQSARKLIEHLVENGAADDIIGISPAIIEDYVSSCIVSRNTGLYYISIRLVSLLVDRGVAPQLAGIKFKPARQKRNGPSHIPPTTWNEIVALGCAYQKLRARELPEAKRNDFDFLRYYTILASLLICAPSRVSELWRTAADIVVLTNPLEHLEDVSEEEAENLDFKLALVWHPVKGGRPVIKPIPMAMQEVARDCVEILRTYGEGPRSTARWIMDNPGVLPIGNEIADLRACRETGTITSEQLKRLFGLPEDQKIGSYRLWRSKFPRTVASHRKTGGGVGRRDYYCFQTLEAEWWKLFKKTWKEASGADWPYAVNTETFKLEADRALLLIYEGQITSVTTYQNKLFLQTPSVKGLVSLLGESTTNRSLFERLDIRLPNGSYPSIQTHDLRHFLNTIAQRAGIPEPIIAAWSGRRNIAQNTVYDHRTDAERLRAHGYAVADYDEAQVDDLLARQVGQAFEGTVAPPSIEVLSATEASVRDLNRQLMISITQFGFCVGDLKSDPCPHAMNCLSCARLVVCKGAVKAKALIEDKLRRLKGQRDLLRAHVEEGGKRLKNDRILPHLDAQIAGAEDMLLALNDPGIEDGTIIARRDRRGAISASFADRVALFAAEQREIQASRTAVENG